MQKRNLNAFWHYDVGMKNLRSHVVLSTIVILMLVLHLVFDIVTTKSVALHEVLFFLSAIITLIGGNIYIIRPMQRENEARIAELTIARDNTAYDNTIYKALFDQSNDAVFFLDLNGNHRAMNERALQMFGYEREAFLKLNTRDMVALGEYTQSQDILARMQQGESIPLYRRMFKRKDGSIFPAEVNVALVRLPDGRPLHIQSLLRDLSEYDQMEKQRLELAVEREKVRFFSEVGQMTSHDLKTPLSTINMNLYFLIHQDNIELRRERATRIEREIQHLTEIIDQMQLMTELAILSTLVMTQVDINELVRTTEGRMRGWVARKNQQITIESESDRLLVMGEAALLTKAIANLVENAILYSSADGSIVVRSHYCKDKNCAEISVRDNGMGIPADALPYVFDSFYKVNKARTPDNSRNGLGLAITRRIIELHNGLITVESAPEKGSVFTISLPVSSQQPQT